MNQEINGFKIIHDFGIQYQKDQNGKNLYNSPSRHYVIAICRLCGNEWEVSKGSLSRIKCCGCVRANQMRVLPEQINGFKVVKDLGQCKKVRSALVICKVCKREYQTNPWQLINRKHCGCIRRGTKVSAYRHTHPRLVTIFSAMKARCYNENDSNYSYYGARGIRVCKNWLNDPDSFCEWALSNGYEDGLTIDRIDGSISYYPENCRWATRSVQARNRNYVIVTLELANSMRKEIGLTQKQIAKKYKVSTATVSNILLNKTWTESCP